jgi:hypothetical protein
LTAGSLDRFLNLAMALNLSASSGRANVGKQRHYATHHRAQRVGP